MKNQINIVLKDALESNSKYRTVQKLKSKRNKNLDFIIDSSIDDKVQILILKTNYYSKSYTKKIIKEAIEELNLMNNFLIKEFNGIAIRINVNTFNTGKITLQNGTKYKKVYKNTVQCNNTLTLTQDTEVINYGVYKLDCNGVDNKFYLFKIL